jgi:uncharacterized membrane protein YjfL (UPF0719 family)
MQAAFLGLGQLVVAILLAVLAVYLGVVLFERTTRSINEWAELLKGNLSVGMVLGSMAVAVALILRPTTQVSVGTSWDVGAGMLPVYVLFTEAIQILIGIVLAIVSIWLALYIFSRLTGQIDEMAELEKDNRSVAVLLVGVILAVALLISSAVGNLSQALTSLLW